MAAQRFTTAEKKALDLAQSDVYADVRRAAEAHRFIRTIVVIIIDGQTSCAELNSSIVV